MTAGADWTRWSQLRARLQEHRHDCLRSDADDGAVVYILAAPGGHLKVVRNRAELDAYLVTLDLARDDALRQLRDRQASERRA